MDEKCSRAPLKGAEQGIWRDQEVCFRHSSLSYFVTGSRAVSSAVEHCFHTAGVTGSIPVPPTTHKRSVSPSARGRAFGELTVEARKLSFKGAVHRACKANVRGTDEVGRKRAIPRLPVSKRALDLSERPALLRQEFPPIRRKTFPRLHR